MGSGGTAKSKKPLGESEKWTHIDLKSQSRKRPWKPSPAFQVRPFRAILRAFLTLQASSDPLLSTDPMATPGLQRSDPPLTRGLWEV